MCVKIAANGVFGIGFVNDKLYSFNSKKINLK